ncbi:MAG TPA: YajQ family cyclic di-GMP-binding protein [Thermodesulfobacteriota bacterium]|nr:YajQ family cyclic di-GMP-binding protein [Thermodesulfobacteriota bacterium]
MPSFDIVSPVDLQEVDNALNQAVKEIRTRFDFKGSRSEIRRGEKGAFTIIADDEFKRKAVLDVVQSKLAKRGVSLRAMRFGKVEPAAGGTLRQEVTFLAGIPVETAREIVKAIREAGFKVQPQVQDGQVRVSGKSKDELQAVIRALKARDFGLDLQFANYRD